MRALAVACLAAIACGPFPYGPPPRIDAFSADAQEVGSGEPLALHWRASYASSFVLSGVGPVGSSGTTVRPAVDSDYVLTVTGLGGTTASAPLHVRVRASLMLAVAPDAGGTQLLARLRTARGEPPSSDVAVHVEAPLRDPVDIPCRAGQAACSVRVAQPPILNADYSASAVLDGTQLFATARPDDTSIDEPGNVRASLRDGLVRVAWDPVRGAAAYRAQLVDLAAGEPIGDAVPASGASAALAWASLPLERAGVSVEAWSALEPGQAPLAISRATGFVSAGPQGGTGEAWQLFGPEEFQGGELDVTFPQLAMGERLAVIAVNAGGRDGAQLFLQAAGVGDPEAEQGSVAPSSGAVALTVARASPVHDLLREHQDESLRAALGTGLAPAAAAPAPASFCIARGLDFGNRVRKQVVRIGETDHAVFFVDAQDAGEVPAGFGDQIGTVFESRIYPADRVVFGEESDVDRNGKLFIVMSHELGAHLNGGWLLGYFGNDDLLRARDDSGDCGGTGSNHADIIYLNSFGNAAANGYSASDAGSTLFPATVAHELQHLINLNRRCLQQKCSGPEATWINEGLSKLAEDLTGFGWNAGEGRWEGAQYLSRAAGTVRGYDGRSLTRWEGDPIGNYQGTHSFLRYFADRRGPAFAAAIAGGPGGVPGVESAVGLPLPRAMAEWATALLFSGEAGSPAPRFSYLGDAWSPLHDRLRHLDWQGLGPDGAGVSLRSDGIAILMTGGAVGGPAELRLRSAESVPPHVVVARYAGDLPR